MSKLFNTFSRGAVILLLVDSGPVSARFNFDSGFLQAVGMDAQGADFSSFSRGATFLPGEYRLAVYVNGIYMSSRSVSFKATDNEGDPQPCFSVQDMDALGITLPYENISECTIPKAEDRFYWRTDMSAMTLELTLPQIYTQHSDIFLSPWQSWEQGLNAAMLNYDYSYNQQRTDIKKEDSHYLSLESGLNIEGFRFRNSSTLTRNSKGEKAYDSLQTYVQKDYHYLQGGEFTAGQTWTDGSLFESVQFKGISLASSDGMLKNEYRNFTPSIQGVVHSQTATVSVKKNNRVIHQSNLPSGPFSLDGIMSNGGGDYIVEIEEADGSVRRYVQSSESLPELQSKGRLKYAFSSGQSDLVGADNVYFNQLGIFYGMDHNVTLYGGTVLTSAYQAYSLGVGKMMDSLGAASVDVTASKADHEHIPHPTSGEGCASYFKDFDHSASSFGLFAYRYSSKGFLSFNEFLESTRPDHSLDNKKNRFELSLMQGLGDFGSMSLSGRKETYWSDKKGTKGFRINHNYGGRGYSINTYYDRSKTLNNKDDEVFGLALTVNWNENGKGASLSQRVTRDNGQLFSQSAVNINPLDNKRLNVALSASIAESEHGMYGINSSYAGNFSDLGAGYYKSPSSTKLNATLSGGSVLHGKGVTLGKRISMDSPTALVSTNGFSGIRVTNGVNIETDYFGRALVPNLQPWQTNQVSIDTLSLVEGNDALQTDKTTVPMKGAIIPVHFDVIRGKKALFQVQYKNKQIPLGALAKVTSKLGQVQSAYFADQGQVYFTGLDDKGIAEIKWNSSYCQFEYDFSSATPVILNKKTVECK
ncbi:fimbrial biogenesis outer membrane usher protein [Salmonella enterica subsp. enterica]|nr:fimbrial biogenesis outer membrane usher protein [Salmonella enterica subsp. enterica serovar Teko]EDV9731989.1 fimbrial biogenesis outer membrane usher protein [Salmonella enterica subsp. enterica]EDW0778014.1 fimbrial biogenesis outer membrane usher protein [Salmonella enterica subsp. enterica serovar Teko]ELF8404239.1 fimbrial biogenesis outer membrane usher protein [Salmonella enterica]